MLGAQTLDPSTQREIQPPRLAHLVRCELGNLELQRYPHAPAELMGYASGPRRLGSSDPANTHRPLVDFAAAPASAIVNGEELWKGLPDKLQEIAKEIAYSRYILDLAAEAEPAVRPYAEATWSRAAILLARISLFLLDEDREKIDVPKILPGPEGTIDIHWDEPDYELLINIPADPGGSAAFYGDNKGRSKIKGSFDTDQESNTPLLAYRTLRRRTVK